MGYHQYCHKTHVTWLYSLTLSLPRSLYQFSLLSAIEFVMMLVWRIWFSPNNPEKKIFCDSPHLSAWYCIDILRRYSLIITHGSLRVRCDIKLFEIFTVKDEMKKSFELEWYESCLLLLWMETEPVQLKDLNFYILNFFFVRWSSEHNHVTHAN